jgi:hypothetical protein
VEQTPEQIPIRDYLVSVRPGMADRPSQTPEQTFDADIVSGVVSKTLTEHRCNGIFRRANRKARNRGGKAEPHKFVDFASPFISSTIALTTIVYRPALGERGHELNLFVG